MRGFKPINRFGLVLLLVAMALALLVPIASADVFTPAGGMFSCHQTARINLIPEFFNACLGVLGGVGAIAFLM